MEGRVISGLVVLAGAIAGEARGEDLRDPATVREVRALTVDQAREARPVKLRGVVTALSGWKNSFFLQDSTAGISVDRTDDADVQVGDQVEVTGVSGAGMFAPVVLASYVHVSGQVSPLGRAALPTPT